MTQTIESKGRRIVPTLGFFFDRLWVWLTGIAFCLIGAVVLAVFYAVLGQRAGGLGQPGDADRAAEGCACAAH